MEHIDLPTKFVKTHASLKARPLIPSRMYKPKHTHAIPLTGMEVVKVKEPYRIAGNIPINKELLGDSIKKHKQNFLLMEPNKLHLKVTEFPIKPTLSIKENNGLTKVRLAKRIQVNDRNITIHVIKKTKRNLSEQRTLKKHYSPTSNHIHMKKITIMESNDIVKDEVEYVNVFDESFR